MLGRSLREHFNFPRDFVPLNNGSFGAHPIPVTQALRRYQDLASALPDTFIRFELPGLLRQARGAVATLLNAPLDELVLVQNVTTAFNAVVRSIRWEPGDVILAFETSYAGVAKTTAYLAESTPAQRETVEATAWPLEDADLLERFTDAIEKINRQGSNRRVRMAVLDTISSMPAVRLPFVELVQRCREHGVLSFLDGAHGVGQIPLDLAAIDADFFSTNLHKWLFVPRGCAVLHVPERHQGLIRSSIPTSHGFKPLVGSAIGNPLPPSSETPFVELFEFVGTIDNSNYLCIPDALAFRRDVCGGEAAIMQYMLGLAREAGDAAAAILGTQVMDNHSGTLRNCAFANVKLPLAVEDVEGAEPNMIVQWIAKRSVERNTMIAVAFYRGSWWWRISAAAYLDLQDIVYGASLLKELCEQLKSHGPTCKENKYL